MTVQRRTVLGGLGLAVGLAHTTRGLAGSLKPTTVSASSRIDVRGAGLRLAKSKALAQWGGRGANGVLSANNCHLEKDGKPLAIAAGELHIQRVPPEEWEAAIVQMKAAGLNTVSSYVFWNQIEPERGKFDFTGRNELRRFFGLCQRHGMMAVLRPGPFCNAEFLLGGLPVWLFGLPTVERSNDALYLDLVRRYFAALAAHLDGQFWHQGGPVAIIQLENELSVAPVGWSRPFLYGAPVIGHTGPTGAAFTDHYRHLHAIALTTGLIAPFYSATSWGTSEKLPIDVVMPTFGGYMDLVPSGPNNSPLTIFHREGADYDDKVPVGFIEIGYGTPMRDAFRPRPSPDHGYCSTLTLFGASRSLMVGYYMFRGGSNPVNGMTGWTTKDAVFPLISYDFWAPIGEFGEWRESLYRARPFNLFVRDFAPELALAEPRSMDKPVSDPDDDRLRIEARFAGARGFVFLSNFADVHPLSPRKNIAIEVATDDGIVRMPASGGVDLPSGMMGVWPVNLDLGGGATLRSATAQPVCRLTVDGVRWHVFCQTGTVPPEFAIATAGARNVRLHGSGGSAERVGDIDILRPIPGRGSYIELTATDGSDVRLLALTEYDAQRMALLGGPETPRLAISDAIVTQIGKTLSITSSDPTALAVSLFPPIRPSHGRAPDRDGIFSRVAIHQPAVETAAKVEKIGDDRARITLPASAFAGIDDIYMDVTYAGDVCRVFDAATGQLLADNMNDGHPWAIGLRRFSNALASAGVLIRAEPNQVAARTKQQGGSMTLAGGERPAGAAVLSAIVFRPRYLVTIECD